MQSPSRSTTSSHFSSAVSSGPLSPYVHKSTREMYTQKSARTYGMTQYVTQIKDVERTERRR